MKNINYATINPATGKGSKGGQDMTNLIIRPETGLLETFSLSTSSLSITQEDNGTISIIPCNGREFWVGIIPEDNKIVLSPYPIDNSPEGIIRALIKDDSPQKDEFIFEKDELSEISGNDPEILQQLLNFIDLNLAIVKNEDNFLKVIKNLVEIDPIDILLNHLDAMSSIELERIFDTDDQELQYSRYLALSYHRGGGAEEDYD